MITAIPTLLVGCLGALAPEIVRLYKARTKSRPEFTGYYFVISFLHALVAGVFCLILPADNLRSAFYVGATFPTLLSGLTPRRHMTLCNEAPREGTVMETAASLAAKRTPWQIFQDHAKALFL